MRAFCLIPPKGGLQNTDYHITTMLFNSMLLDLLHVKRGFNRVNSIPRFYTSQLPHRSQVHQVFHPSDLRIQCLHTKCYEDELLR